MDEQRRWKRFLFWLIGFFVGGLMLCIGLIVLANPYGNIPVAPFRDRPIMDINQRWMYPAVARNPRFDSMVTGTSTIRLLEPTRLEGLFGGSFAQLAMNSGTAWEQVQITNLFLRQEREEPPRTIIIGIDIVWCGKTPGERITFRGFPDWLYDDSPWNDFLHMINGMALEITARVLTGYPLGIEKPRYDAAGWANFLPPEEEYDLDRARIHLYGSSQPVAWSEPEMPAPNAAERATWDFPDVAMLGDLLDHIPVQTRAILVFVPYHLHRQGHPGSLQRVIMDECKVRVAGIAQQQIQQRGAQIHLLDFMIESPITADDMNYWDPLHYGMPTARMLADLIAEGVFDPDPEFPYYRVLAPVQE